MESTVFNLKEVTDILSDQKITKLQIGYRGSKANSFRRRLADVSALLMRLFPEWEKAFNEELSLEEFNKLLVDPLNHIHEKYIKMKGYDVQLSFVKREKLMDIVDFPDFSRLTSILNDLASEMYGPPFGQLFSFNKLFESKGSIPADADHLISEYCKVYLDDRQMIESYMGFLLYVKSFNYFKKSLAKWSWNVINQRLVGSQILSNAPDYHVGSSQLDVELLFKNMRIDISEKEEIEIITNRSK